MSAVGLQADSHVGAAMIAKEPARSQGGGAFNLSAFCVTHSVFRPDRRKQPSDLLCWSALMDHDRIRQAQVLRVKALKCRRWAVTACDREIVARLTAMASAYEGQADALEQGVAAPGWAQQGR